MKTKQYPHRRKTAAGCLLALVAALGTPVQAKDIIVTTTNNESPGSGLSLLQAIGQLADGDFIKFNIPGEGPHVITTPLGGYPLITANNVTIDGYSQPGSRPNSNGILGGNNAQIRIVLDSSADDSRPSPDPANEALLVRRSTRLPFSGYGDSENAILGVLEADGFKARGLSFVARYVPGTDSDPSIYAVALVKEAKNAKIQGCWFGLKPGDAPTMENLKPVTDAVAAFRWRDASNQNPVYSGGLTFGTDGDGANDVQEFNVVLGAHIALGIEAPNLRVSGNYINVFPDGLTFANVEAVLEGYTSRTDADIDTVEFMENGRLTDNTIIGTNGDGRSDGNERNIIALPAYDQVIEFYSNATNTVVAGNYFGVGVDGITAQPELTAFQPNLIGGATGQFRVGSNGDGVSDDIEGNQIVKVKGTQLVAAAVGVPLTIRRNTIVNSGFDGFPFAENGATKTYEAYLANALADSAADQRPAITAITAGVLTGTLPAPNTANYAKHVVDVYVVDAEAPVGIPNRYAGSFVDGGAGDLDSAANRFRVNLAGFKIRNGDSVALAVTYTSAATGTPGTNSITGPLSASAIAEIPALIPGSVESAGLTRIVADKPILVPDNDALGNWEPYISVMGTSTFLIEGNTFAEGTTDKQRYVVALQPAAGGVGRTVDGFYADNGTPFRGAINASRQNGNPGRVAGDKRPGATKYIVGGEASPHTLAEFGSDNRWNLGFNRLVDGRYGTVQTYLLDTASLTPTPLTKATDSAYGRLTSGTTAGNQVSRFGGDLAALDNGNFVSVVQDNSRVLTALGDATVATVFAPDGTVVKDSFVVSVSDIWANVAAYQGGFAVRCKPTDGSNTRVIHLFDNSGNSRGTIAQTSSGAAFDTGRGDGTRIAGHINSPYVFLFGQPAGSAVMTLAAWDTRNPERVALFEGSEPAFAGGFDRANLAVDALNRITVSWVSKPEGYEQQQVAARVLALNGDTMTISALTPSFLAFVNAAKTGDIRSVGMSVAMTTRQICIAAKGEINLNNRPDQGASINPNTGAPLREINFYTVFSHPAPAEDPTPGANAAPTIAVRRNSDGSMTITWTGSLQSSATLNGTYQAVAGTSPLTVQPSAGAQFYRSR
jgi:hypothetical protein